MRSNKAFTTAVISVLTFAMAAGFAGCSNAATMSENAVQSKTSDNAETSDNAATDSTNAEVQKSDAKTADAVKSGNSSSDKPITIVWYPNESAADYQPARDEIANVISEATGRKVEHKLTTDYAIAIESLASGSADICFMGAAGYIEAKNKNPEVNTLFVNSGPSGTLDDALYYSWLAVNKGQESNYMDGDKYSIANIQGKKISFVSNSSTSGFKIPTTNILGFFQKTDKWKNLTVDDLVEGGSDKFFSTVLFGGSHQGSAFNLLSGKCDIAAFCDTELAAYADLKEGSKDQAGAVYAIKADATAPFDSVQGKEFAVIESTPVLNGPFAYNPANLGDDVKKIQDAFLSDAVAQNTKIFVDKASEDAGAIGMFEKTDKEKFVMVDDSWYDKIRNLGK